MSGKTTTDDIDAIEQYDLDEMPDFESGFSRIGRWQRVFRDILRNRLAVIGGFIVIGIIVLGALAPLIAPYGPQEMNLDATREPPSLDHPFGTDFSGRDIFSRVLYGARITPYIG
ncbi:MAG: ABC transporter permease, partial [Halobacteriaceae archaeon]